MARAVARDTKVAMELTPTPPMAALIRTMVVPTQQDMVGQGTVANAVRGVAVAMGPPDTVKAARNITTTVA